MLPTKSNTEQGCSPVSSNCVIWQGPNIACINLCTGDSISDVTYKLALEICDLKAQLDMSDLDLSCLVENALRRVDPETTLAYVLDLLITKVCSIDDIINGVSEDNGSVNLDPIVTIPQNASCFYTTDENGNTVTSVAISSFTKRIAVQVCNLKTTTTAHTTTLTDHETRIYKLENATTTNPIFKVTPTCTFGSTAEQDIDVAWEALEKQFCELRTVTGTPTALSAALTYQCASLGSEPALSVNGTMATIPGWKTTVTSMADALTNLFITVCDMRASVKDIAVNGGTGGGSLGTTLNCSSVIIDFAVSTNTERSDVTLNFSGLTTIPDGVTDQTTQGAKVTITDSNGGKYINYVNVTNNKVNTNGITFTVTGLNTALNYTVLVEGVFVKDGVQCTKSVSKVAPISCGIVTNVSASFV